MSGSTPAGKGEASGGNPDAAGSGSTADSYNTADNRRVYGYSQHNERNIFNVWNRPKASTLEDWEELERLVDADGDWDLLLDHLTIAEQDAHRCNIQLDWNEPKYFWITKNIDFTQWRSVDNSQALHICGPHHRGMKEVASHVIDRAKEAATQSGGIAMYYFSSTAPADQPPSSVFAHTLLRQIVTAVESGKANSTASVFLRTLFRGLYRRNLLQFKKGESLSAALRTALNFPRLEDLWGVALVEAIREAHARISSITIEMVDDDVLFRDIIVVVKHVMAADATVKVLLLGPLSGAHSSNLNSLEFLTRIEYDKERKECLRSLRYSDTRYDNVSEEHLGSLEWLWNHPEYLKWSSSAGSSLLYIEGKPGSGKSTLAKYFATNLRDKEPIASTTGCTIVHYFYTLRGTKYESTHENMLRSILHSLLDNDETAFFHFQHQYRKIRASGEWTYASLKPVLSSFANHPPEKPVYLILDAMDESTEDDRQDIIRLLCDLCSTNNPCSIKVFLTSRPVAGLQDQIENTIRLQDENERDIQAFVNSFRGELTLTGPIIDEATQYIIANAEGVFVWVSLVRGELARITAAGYNDMQIMDHLRGLPKELQEFYELMLGRLHQGSPVDIQDGKTLFQFVRFSVRPIQATELQHVLTIQPYSDGFSTISHLEFKKRLSGSIEARIAHCGGNFLEITANKTVQLMHQSAQEFFLKIEQEKRRSEFALDSDEAYRTIAMTLVAYLVTCFTNPRFSKIKTWGSEDLRLYARYLGEWRLLGYAIPHLKQHYELCSHTGTMKRRISTLIENLNRQLCSRFLGDWFADQFGRINPGRIIRRALANVTLRPLAASDKQTPEELGYKILDAVAAQAPNWVFEMMVNPCTHFEVRARNETPLIVCVRRELVDASRMCLSCGVDVDAKGIKGQTALHQAAMKGNNDIVTILLRGNANKKIQDDDGFEALQLALKKFPVDLKGRQILYDGDGDRGLHYYDYRRYPDDRGLHYYDHYGYYRYGYYYYGPYYPYGFVRDDRLV